MEGNKGKVCVTGGTGFLASWLIMRLLEHGYSVHTTIRPDPGELLFLFSLSTQLGGDTRPTPQTTRVYGQRRRRMAQPVTLWLGD